MFRLYISIVALIAFGGCADKADSPNTVNDQSTSTSESIHGRGSSTSKWWDSLPRQEWAAYERVLPEQNWFEIYRVLPDIYAIYEPRQFEEVISFLVVGKDRALLFDTGLGIVRMRPVISQLTNLEVLVVNSHSHYDHVGGNYEFDNIQGIDHEFSRKKTKGRSAAEVKEFVSGDWMAKPVPEDVDVSDYAIKPYIVASFLDDGTIIDLGDRQLQVVRTPGHTPDSLCLIDRENRLLFTGDTFYLAPLYVHLKESNLQDYHDSINRLSKLEPFVDKLLTAHNVPIADSDYLRMLKLALDAIEIGPMPYVRTEGANEYQFGDFSVIVPGK